MNIVKRFLTIIFTLVIACTAVTAVFAQAETKSGDIIILGDVNNDGILSAVDARIVLQFSADIILLGETETKSADYDGSGTVTAVDARIILRVSAGLPAASTANPGNNAVSQYKSGVQSFSTNITDPGVFYLLNDLSAMLKQYNNLSLYYINAESGKYIAYRENVSYRSQCTIKAPFARYALSVMNNYGLTLDSAISLKSSQKYSFGTLKDYPAGSQFTLRQVFEHALLYSDNSAYKMLFEKFGNSGFNAYSGSLGVPLRLGSYMFGSVSAKDMAKYFVDIYHYKGAYSDFLMDCLKESSYRSLIPYSIPKYEVAHKYGYGGGASSGMHDAAIVFAESPFILSIFSTIEYSSSHNYGYPFHEASKLITQINDMLV